MHCTIRNNFKLYFLIESRVLTTIAFDIKEKVVKSNGVKVETFVFSNRCFERDLLSFISSSYQLVVIYLVYNFVTNHHYGGIKKW